MRKYNVDLHHDSIISTNIYNVDLCQEHNHSHQNIQCGYMTQHIDIKKEMSTEESSPKVFIYK